MSKKKTTIPRPFGQPNYLKKEAKKAPEPKARYNNGNKVFIISYAFAGNGVILEGEIAKVDTHKYPIINENGRISGNETHYSYLVHTVRGDFDVNEPYAYPSYAEVSKVFARGFLFLLK